MARQANPLSEENIRRIDTKRRAPKQTHGFQVHILRGGEVVTKLFSDAMFGGVEGSRRAARKFKRSMIGQGANVAKGKYLTSRRKSSRER